MRHLLMDPAFPDIVEEWAREALDGPANDNGDYGWDRDDVAEEFLIELARIDIEATRDW